MEWICRVVEKNAHHFISPVFLLISFIVVFDIETKKGRVFNCTNCLTRKFKNWAFAKICWKLTVLMRFVEIFNLSTIILIIWKFHTPRFGREIVERRLQKKSFYIATFMKKKLPKLHFSRKNGFTTLWLCTNTSIFENMLQEIHWKIHFLTHWDNPLNIPMTAGESSTRLSHPSQSSRCWVVIDPSWELCIHAGNQERAMTKLLCERKQTRLS